MKHITSFVFALLCGVGTLVALTSCNGGGGSSSDKTAGVAPDKLTGLVTLTPRDANVHGVITLTPAPAEVAYFNNQAGTDGAYTGNYTYTKVGPDLAELKMENLRYEPIQSASDCHWTIVATIRFYGNNTVVLDGTETLIDSDAEVNDPFHFGDVDHNHFDPSHDGGGTRNFRYNYTFEMGNN